MLYLTIFFATLCLFLVWLLLASSKQHLDTIENLQMDINYLKLEVDERDDAAEIYWNRSEGYRTIAEKCASDLADTQRCLEVVLTDQAQNISRELDNAYDSLSMVLTENEKLRAA